MLHTNQDRIHILYKPGPELYIADWPSHNNHGENRNQEITGMNINIHMISTAEDLLTCTSIEDVRAALNEDRNLQILKTYIITRWPQTKDEIEPGVERY